MNTRLKQLFMDCLSFLVLNSIPYPREQKSQSAKIQSVPGPEAVVG